MKKIFIILSFLAFSAVSHANHCSDALPTNTNGFCNSFKSVAACYCTSKGLPRGMCNDMKTIYKRMIGFYGSIENACRFQRDTTTQTCIDDWNCYLYGGVDSNNQPCDGTGLACEG